MKSPWRVQLVVDGELEYFREAMLGARRRAHEGGRVEFVDRWLPHEAGEDPRVLVRRDGVRGVVVAINDPVRESVFAGLGVPVVNISNTLLAPRLPVVTQDDREVGRRAAEHLLGRGLRRFLFWGQGGARYSEERRAGFEEVLAGAGLGRGALRHEAGVWSSAPRAADLARMGAVLAGLERPAGAFAVMDAWALALLRAAREAGWRVPEDLAVLGAGDDDFYVEFERTPLASIRLPARQVGYEATALLERLIARGGRGEASGFVALSGARVVARRSTETPLAGGGDELVAKAAGLLRERPGLRVAEVARACGVARSGLQRRFLAALGHGLLAERRRLRLERAERLLACTNAKLATVAAEAGYPSAQRLSADMRQVHECTPGEWRRRTGVLMERGKK